MEVEWRKNRAELDAACETRIGDAGFEAGVGEGEGVCSLRWLDFAQTPIRLSFYEHFARHSCVRVLYRQKLFAKLRSILTLRTPVIRAASRCFVSAIDKLTAIQRVYDTLFLFLFFLLSYVVANWFHDR